MPAFPSLRIIALLLIGALAACSAHEDRDKEASKILKGWTGQPIGVALDTLGPPAKNTQKSQKKIYLWTTERDENVRVIGGREIVRDGVTDDANEEHFSIKASCRIIIVTDMDDIILGSGMKGQVLTCSQFADTLLAAKTKTLAQ